MTGQIAFFSRGLARLRPQIRCLSGLDPVFSLVSPGGAQAVAGWGHKPTARRARAAAARTGLPYVAFEDGFLRSLKPGESQPPASLVMDRSGIYYDARGPSDLETILQTASFAASELARASELLELIARHRLSKYNHGANRLEAFACPSGRPLVLVVDQTMGDASIAGGLGDAATFARMAEAAVAENPGAFVVARLHPETMAGSKPGYLRSVAERLGLAILSQPVSPWALFDLAPRVYTVSSQFGFEALLAGLSVSCFGAPFYSGWGLTDDRAVVARRTARLGRDAIAAGVYLRYARYFDCWRRTPVEAETAVDQLAFLRRAYLGNTKPVVGYRIARWKRRAVAAMLDGPAGPPRFTSNLRRAKALAGETGAAIAAWGIAAVRLRPELAAEATACLAIEDGFLRSVGLGAAFVRPLSLVFDWTGLYYDPRRPSDIETLLRTADISQDEVTRAAALRRRIVAGRITKYNVAAGNAAALAVPADRAIVLVPGQVADDWAVMLGRPAEFPPDANLNAVLLQRVRDSNPDAYVIFKPHPDVEHLGRAGALDGRQARDADIIAPDTSLEQLLAVATHVETYSSLAGFEALLRGVAVTTHGVPFYAGWGLTRDRAEAPRRGRTRSLDELAAAALIHYPRYWDPVTGLACPPEVALDRLGQARAGGPRGGPILGLAAGRGIILARRMLKFLKRPAGDL